MATGREMLERMQAVNIPMEVSNALQDASAEVIDKMQDQLYEHGVDKRGNPFPSYAASTIARKKRKGQRYDHVTGKDKGDMYAEMYQNVSGNTVERGSSVSHTQYFIAHYPANEPFGLTPANETMVANQVVMPMVRRAIKSKTGLK